MAMTIYILTVNKSVLSAHTSHQKAKEAANVYISQLSQPASTEWSTAGFEAHVVSKGIKSRMEITETAINPKEL